MEPPSTTGSKATAPPTVVMDKGARTAAVAAAAAAAAQAAPGQRERAVERAAVAALAAAAQMPSPESAGAKAGTADTGTPSPQQPVASYEAPEWAGVPEGVDYSIEVLKNGAIIETRAVADKDHYTFGRTPNCDFVLEHPSASRLHAVLQYKGETREAFLYDNHSTHGTWVNKQRVNPGVYVPLRVGDTIKFGVSSRLLVLCGPTELLPPEGLTRSAKLKLAQLEYAAKIQEREKEASKAAMAAALSGANEVTWGMGGPDAVDDDDIDAMGDVDWRALLAQGKLSEKQQKMAEKIKQREYKMKNMEQEVDRIMAKERQEGGLTPGQATTVANNEQGIDRLRAEVEDLEELLADSIRDALAAKRKASKQEPARRKRTTTASDDEYLEGSDSEDDFYDRTAGGMGGARKRARGQGGSNSKVQPQQVESAASLYGKREVLSAERQELLQAIQQEEQARAAGTDTSAAPHSAPAAAAADAADAAQAAAGAAASNGVHSDATPRQQQGEQAVGLDQGGQQGSGTAAMQVDGEAAAAAHPKETASIAKAGRAASSATAGQAADDSLDAFMNSMEQQLEGDKLKSMRAHLTQLESELARVERLLKIADPDGWLKPGMKVAQAAKAAAAERLAAERQTLAAAAAAAAKKQAEVPAFQEEHESDDEAGGAHVSKAASGAGTTQQAGGQTAAPKPVRPVVLRPNMAPVALAKQPLAAAGAHAHAIASSKNSAAAAEAARLIAEFSGSMQQTQHELAGGAAADMAAPRSMPSVRKDRQAGAKNAAAMKAAEAKVEQDLNALSNAEQLQKELQQLAEQERQEAEAAARLAQEHEVQQKKLQELQQKLGY